MKPHPGAEHVLMPAMQAEEGLPRLEAIARNWLGWTAKAGLSGGCPVAAGLFEMDDLEGAVRKDPPPFVKRRIAFLDPG